jgi:hypothetical protein
MRSVSESLMIEDVQAVPFLRRGLGLASADALRRLMEAYWFFVTDLQNLREDIEGIDGRREYLLGLKIRLAERLYEMDQLLGGREALDGIHHLALALQLGASTVAGLSGPDLLGMVRTAQGPLEDEVQMTRGVCEAITSTLPGKVHGPFDAQGERYMLRLLQRWFSIAKTRNEPLSFIKEYLRTSS